MNCLYSRVECSKKQGCLLEELVITLDWRRVVFLNISTNSYVLFFLAFDSYYSKGAKSCGTNPFFDNTNTAYGFHCKLSWRRQWMETVLICLAFSAVLPHIANKGPDHRKLCMADASHICSGGGPFHTYVHLRASVWEQLWQQRASPGQNASAPWYVRRQE